MIPSPREISDGMTGAWRLAVVDPDALDSFDFSADGFLKSFTAILLAAPFWFWMTLANRNAMTEMLQERGENIEMPPFGQFVAVEAVSYLAAWLFFLAIMFMIVRVLNVEDRFVPFVIVYNWATLFLYFLIAMPPVALFNLGILDVAGKFFIDRLLFVVQLIYMWHVARTSLQIDALQAGAIVVLDIVLLLFITQISVVILYS